MMDKPALLAVSTDLQNHTRLRLHAVHVILHRCYREYKYLPLDIRITNYIFPEVTVVRQ